MALTRNNAQAASRGVFVTFEGGDGAGKSTHIRYVAEALRSAGREVLVLREPGGTQVGEALRRVVLDAAHAEIVPETELMMYEAARAQLVAEVIAPALSRGAVVLCDRFADSTLAYQGYGRGLSLDFVREASRFATGGLVPDRTILLVAGTARTGLARAVGSGEGDRMEQAGVDFHARVARGFEQIAQDEPQRVRTVASSRSRRKTRMAVAAELVDLLPELAAVAQGLEGHAPKEPARG